MEYLNFFIIIGFFSKVFGSCPQNSPNTLVNSCDGTKKIGTPVYIDFKQINQLCNCILFPAFEGDLLVLADPTVSQCDTFVRVNNTFIFNCKQTVESTILKVKKTHPVTVESDYKSESSRTRFYHCLSFQENAGGNGHVNVTCGEMTPSTYKTTTKSITTGGFSSEMPPITTETKEDITSTSTESRSANSTSNTSSNFPGPLKELTEDELNYTIVGLAAGGGLLFVATSIIIVVIFLRHRKRNKKENKIPKETLKTFTEHTNNGYEYEHNLPDNPLYHSSQPADEVGYSTVEEQKPSFPDPTMKDSDQTPNIYDTPLKREMAKDRDTKREQPVYATPKKNQSIPVNSTGEDMYAQVNKPNKNTKHSPVRTQNQDGLVYMEVDHSGDSKTENSPYTNDYSSETVAYAEVKTK